MAAANRWVTFGWVVNTQSEHAVTLSRAKSVNHGLHAILTLLTCGMWLIVWLIVAIANNGSKSMTLLVDDHGNVQRSGG